jgi:chromosome segregation protein
MSVGGFSVAFIRRIEISGFKSFSPRKVVINLGQGLTAIVGENGCGKSNVLDAVCFVLGHLSSKSLRAENFASLLFNGGGSHSPAKVCRVAIVFDNSERQLPIDADEVAVSREVDTTGVSAYGINGKRCTRSEVLDTIGVAGLHPEGHNIVMQNELADIVGMSPAEIRQIVEGVAGISVFDEKKRQIEAELEKVDSNLRIVEVRLEEIRGDYGRLERDRGDALRWQAISNEMSRLERDLAFVELARLEERLAEMKAECAKVSENIQEFEAQKQEARARRMELEQSARADAAKQKFLDRELHSKEIDVTRLREKLNGLKFTTANIARRAESLSASVSHLRAAAAQEKEKQTQITELVSRLKAEESVLTKQKGSIQAKLKRISDRISQPDAEYLALRNEVANLTQSIELKRSELGETVALHRVTEQGIADLQRQIADSLALIPGQERDLVVARTHRAGFESDLEHVKGKLAAVEAEKQAIQTSILEREKKQTELTELVQTSREQLLEAQTRLKTIHEFNKLGLTHQAAAQAVLRYAKEQRVSGVHGTLGSLGRTSTEHAIALEVAGGGRLDFVVVDDEDTATKCIDYLKNTKTGRATFVPLRSIKTEPSTYKGKDKGVVGNAISLLSFEEKFRPAFEYIFGRTIIVKNLAVARALDAPGFRKVTLDGDVVEPNRMLSGGYYKHLSSLTLEEETRIPELQRKLKELQELEGKVEGEYQKLKKDSDRVETQLAKMHQELAVLEGKFDKAIEDVTGKEEALTVFKASITKLQEALHGNESAKAKLVEKQQLDQSTIDRLTANRQELQDKLTVLEQTGLDPTLSALRGELERSDNELGQVQLQLTEKTTELRHVSVEEKRLSDDLKASSAEFKRTEEELAQRNKEAATLEGQLSELESTLTSFRKQIQNLEQQLEASEAEQTRLGEVADGLVSKISEEQVNRSKLEARIELWEDRCTVQREKVEGLEPPLVPIDPSSINSLRRRYAELEQEQKALGLINQKAIEQFEKVRHDYEEILEKERRIREEREAILDAMRRAEEEKFKVFMSAFTSISKNFSEIYERLTTGEGHLELENLENPFLGGIRMKVRPAGKQVQYLDALSGGEKALTALTFIFALQLHQPGPFFFLDEIDEALDPANADRVAQLLESLSRKSQFIIISHNEITIRRANALIGVAIVDGMSQAFSVKFEEGLLLIDRK